MYSDIENSCFPYIAIFLWKVGFDGECTLPSEEYNLWIIHVNDFSSHIFPQKEVITR